MNKLLSAGFARLRKDTFFRIALILMFATGILQPVSSYLDMKKYGYEDCLDSIFFSHVLLMGTLSSVFCSLFIGTEYSDGTIRNKLITGHKRKDIYLSSLIVCFAANLLMCFFYIVPALGTGIPLLGFFLSPINLILGSMGCVLVLSAAFAALLTAASMLCQRRSIAAVICIFSVFALLFLGFYLENVLGWPQFTEEYAFVRGSDEVITVPAGPNPYYVGGTRRIIYEFLQDFLPGGQAAQLCARTGEDIRLGLMAVYSCLVAAVSTLVGVRIFEKQDIK